MTPGAERWSSRSAQRAEEGFSLVEALVGMVILMVVVISLTNLLVDSLSTALGNKQREAAASIASDVIENGKALGQTCLTGGACPAFTASTFSLVKGTLATFVNSATGGTATYTVDNIAYTVAPSVTCTGAACTPSYAGAVSVAVTVSWTQAGRASSYFTSTQVTGN